MRNPLFAKRISPSPLPAVESFRQGEIDDADVSQIVGRQMAQHIGVDLVVSELLLVSAEAETAKPLADYPGPRPHGFGR